MTSLLSFEHVKGELVARVEGLARELFPDGDYSGGKKYWIALNPSRADTNPGSFWIWLEGEKAGGWCDAASGQKGDVFQLIQLARGGSVVDAKRWAEWFCGLSTATPPAERERRRAELTDEAQKRKLTAAAELAIARGKAFSIWLGGIPLGKGRERNPAAKLAFDYLEGTRGIDLSRLPRLPGATRLLLDQRHVESGERFAALGSIVIGADHKPIALHRVFITDQGEKIPHRPVRKTWPDYIGGFIPIWDGGTNCSAAAQLRKGTGELTPVIFCEGIEDGFSAAIGKPDHRVRAAVALGNLRHMPLFACDDRGIIWRDNDWGKPQAEAQLEAAASELAQRGQATQTEIYMTASFIGKDANDLMRGEAA